MINLIATVFLGKMDGLMVKWVRVRADD